MSASLTENPGGEGAPPFVPSLRQLCLAFAEIAVTSFGGGVTGWMMRDLVHRRRWFTPEAFLADMAMAQALPGVNVVNLPIWIGYRLYGGFGAMICALSVILPSAAVLAVISTLIIPLQHFHQTALAFAGAAAGAIGLLIASGVQVAKGVVRRPAAAVITVLTFIAIGVLKLPMLPVMVVLVPVSIWLAARRGPPAPEPLEKTVLQESPDA